MDVEDRARLRELCGKATRGPWKYPHQRYPGVVITPHGCLWHPGQGVINDDADAEFVAASRTAVPALLDALDAAEARIAAVEALCADASAEAVGGGLTDADTLWPSDIVAALAGKRKP